MKALLLILFLGVSLTQELRSDPAPIIYPGQVNIGFVSNIHGPPENGTDGCGPLRPEAVQRAMAAVWAAHQANFKKDDPNQLNIGVYIFDTCGREDVAERQMYRLLGHVGHVQTTDCSEKRIPPLFAVVSEGDSNYLEVPLKLLNAFSVPVITSSGPPLPEQLLSTAPNTEALARAAVNVLRQLRLLEVAVMAEDDAPTGLFGDFSRQAQVSGMDPISVDQPDESTRSEEDFLTTLKMLATNGKSNIKAVVFLVKSDEALNLLQLVDDKSLPQLPWLIVTPSDITSTIKKTFHKEQLQRLQKVLLLSPESTDIPEFDEYFQQLLDEDTIKYHPLLIEFMQHVNRTHEAENESLLSSSFYSTSDDFASNSSVSDFMSEHAKQKLFAPADVSSTVKAVWTLAAALKTVQKRSCRRGTDCLLYLRRTLSAYVARAAFNLDHVVQLDTKSLKGTRLKFEASGTLASVHYALRGFANYGEVIDVGYYSDEDGLIVDHNVLMPFKDFVFIKPLSTSTSESSESDHKSEAASSLDEIDFDSIMKLNSTELSPQDITTLEPEQDLAKWDILDVSAEEAAKKNKPKKISKATTKNVPNVLNTDADLVLALNEEGSLHIFASDINTTLRKKDGVENNLIVGPAYSGPSVDSSSSNFRSISLTSHEEPKNNDAYRAEPASRSDRRIDDSQSVSPTSSEDVKRVKASSTRHISAWLARPWALSVLGVCGFLILATLYILVFLMVKACEGSLKKTNCCLAGTQLVALLCLYLAAALFTWKPSPLICGLRRLMPNVSLAFCYGCLLLKGMYLRAQSSLGLGGSVNRCNQILTLLFVVGVQIALETQWWLFHPPALSTEAFECQLGKTEILQSQVYIALLLLLAAAMAISNRRIPYNQQECRSLIATSLSCLVIFLSWAIACWLLPDSGSRNIAAPSTLMATALTVLLGIFGPQLFAIHKYGGFPHKPLSYADSLSTVFTMFKDLDNASSGGTTARGRKNAKTLETPFAGEMSEGTRNPLYNDYQSAYP